MNRNLKVLTLLVMAMALGGCVSMSEDIKETVKLFTYSTFGLGALCALVLLFNRDPEKKLISAAVGCLSTVMFIFLIILLVA